jgi:hypothetical protein
MNIAICISGEPRYLELITKSLAQARQICSDNNFTLHVFYHLWDHITQRQKEIHEAPIIEHISHDDIKSALQPTKGVIDSKDILDPEITYIYNYINDLIKDIEICNNRKRPADIYNLSRDLEKFKYQIKNTNHPPYSQLSTLCKAQMLRIEYEEQNNIKYDIVIRTRTDVEFRFPKSDKLIRCIEHQNESKKVIFFPGMWTSGDVGVEYCFFIGSSYTLNRQIFENYKQDIPEILFKLTTNRKNNKPRLFTTTSHNSLPTLIHKYTKFQLRCSLMGFVQKIHQMTRLFK